MDTPKVTRLLNPNPTIKLDNADSPNVTRILRRTPNPTRVLSNAASPNTGLAVDPDLLDSHFLDSFDSLSTAGKIKIKPSKPKAILRVLKNGLKGAWTGLKEGLSGIKEAFSTGGIKGALGEVGSICKGKPGYVALAVGIAALAIGVGVFISRKHNNNENNTNSNTETTTPSEGTIEDIPSMLDETQSSAYKEAYKKETERLETLRDTNPAAYRAELFST